MMYCQQFHRSSMCAAVQSRTVHPIPFNFACVHPPARVHATIESAECHTTVLFSRSHARSDL